MRSIPIAILVAVLPALAAADDSRQPPGGTQTTPRPAKSNPCAVYGAGFVQIEGTSTCVKMGGSVTVEVGGRR